MGRLRRGRTARASNASRVSHVDEKPEPTFAERLFTRAIGTNADYTVWAQGHNAANAADHRTFDTAVTTAQATGAHETRVDALAGAGDANARHEQQMRGRNDENINKNLPPNADKMGTQVDTGAPGGSPIRDINSVTVEGKSWGFVYRTADGSLMVQRDSASIPVRSTSSSWGGGASAGISKDPFTLQVNGSYSYATTLTDPTQQKIAKLTDPDKQLPAEALVSPLRDASGIPLPGSAQLVPAIPHQGENTYDRAKPAPEKFAYDLNVDLSSANQTPAMPYAMVAMNRAGEASVTIAPPEQDRARTAEVGHA